MEQGTAEMEKGQQVLSPNWALAFSTLQPMVQPPERTITSPGELFRTPTHCKKSGGSWRVGSSERTFLALGVPPHLKPHFPLSPAGRLPPELLAFWTHCAQPPPRALRRRPPLEPEEEAAERELVAEEERRKPETPSDIEVPAPSLFLEWSALPEPPQASCPHEQQCQILDMGLGVSCSGAKAGSGLGLPHPCPRCFCNAWGLSALSLIPRS